MKSYFSLTLLGFLGFYSPLGASFSGIEVYKTPLQQPIFFLEDAHDYKKERDGHYFDTLLKIFEEADKDAAAEPNSIEYLVFVENSPAVNLDGLTPPSRSSNYILESLYERVKEKPYKRTKVIDCNPRTVSRALRYLFGDGERMFPLFRRNDARQEAFKQIYKCGYFTVTFKEVADSFDTLKNQMLEYRSQWTDPKILEMFDGFLRRMQKESLMRVYQEFSVDENQTIFNYLENVESGSLKREQFANMVVNVFSDFVDLFTLHHILLERNNTKIKKFIVIAGNAHTGEINMALENLKMGYKQIYRERPSDIRIHLFFKENGLRLLQAPLSAIKITKPKPKWNDPAHIVLFVIIGGIVYFYYY